MFGRRGHERHHTNVERCATKPSARVSLNSGKMTIGEPQDKPERVTGEPKDNPEQHAEHERLAEQSERWRKIQKSASKELLVEMVDTSTDGLQARFLTGDSNAREEILRALEARI
jgi:hypothetical protein